MMQTSMKVILVMAIDMAFSNSATEPIPVPARIAPPQIFSMSRDGRYLLTTNGLCNLETKKWEWNNRLPASFAEFLPNADTFVTCGVADSTVRVFSTPTCKMIRGFAIDHRNLYSAALSPDGKALITSGDGFLKEWDVSTGRLARTFHGRHGATVLAISADGKFMLSGDRGTSSTTVKLWDLVKAKEIWSVEGHRWNVFAVAFSPNGKHVLTAGESSSINIRQVENGTLVQSLQVGGKSDTWESSVSAAAFTRSGRHVIVSAQGSPLTLWELSTGKAALIFDSGRTFSPNRIVATPDGKEIITSDGDLGIVRWDLRDGQSISQVGR